MYSPTLEPSTEELIEAQKDDTILFQVRWFVENERPRSIDELRLEDIPTRESGEVAEKLSQRQLSRWSRGLHLLETGLMIRVTNASSNRIMLSSSATITSSFSGFNSVSLYKNDRPNSTECVWLFEKCRGSFFCDVQTLRVDHDTVLSSKEFDAAMEVRNIDLQVAPTEHQQAETRVRVVKKVLRTTLDSLPKKYWSSVIFDVSRYLNALPSSEYGVSPIQILTGWAPRNLIPFAETATETKLLSAVFKDREELWLKVRKTRDEYQEKQEKYYNRSRKDLRFVVGQHVLIKRNSPEARDGNFNLSPPYDHVVHLIVAVLSEVSYLVKPLVVGKEHSAAKVVHVSDMKEAVSVISSQDLKDEEYIVKAIHDHTQVDEGQSGRLYLVEWNGYPRENQFTWEPGSELVRSVPELIWRYEYAAGLI